MVHGRRAIVFAVTAALVGGAAIAATASPGGSGSTTTALSCSPNPLHAGAAGAAAQCTATVNGARKPSGSVSFTALSGIGTFTPSSCTLSGGSCSASFAPERAGTFTLTASYGGGSGWRPSSGSADLAVMWSSTTALSCSPSDAPVGSPVTCEAVARSGGGTPTDGRFTFTSTGTGSFGSQTCSAAADCSVTYTTGARPETATITAAYSGSSSYDGSQASATVTSAGRSATLTRPPVAGEGVAVVVCNSPSSSCFPYDGVTARPGACTARLTDTATGDPIVGAPLSFSGACEGTVDTDAEGVAVLPVLPATYGVGGCAFFRACTQDLTYAVSFAGNGVYAPVQA